MNTLEVKHKFDHVKVYINDDLVEEKYNCNGITYTLDQPLPLKITIEFFPFNIKPIIRFNDFMLNYWLADILLQDHQLEFIVSETFYQDYKNKNINGRIASLPTHQQHTEDLWDKYIGIDNLHPDLVNEIKNLIT